MATVHGKKGLVKIDGSTVGKAREWSADIQTERDDDTSFGDDWRSRSSGIKEVTGSIDFSYDSADSAIIDGALGDVTVSLELYPDGAATTKALYGEAFLDCNLSISVTGVGRGTGSFESQGTWDFGTPS